MKVKCRFCRKRIEDDDEKALFVKLWGHLMEHFESIYNFDTAMEKSIQYAQLIIDIEKGEVIENRIVKTMFKSEKENLKKVVK